jgi:hypothetical protein
MLFHRGKYENNMFLAMCILGHQIFFVTLDVKTYNFCQKIMSEHITWICTRVEL